MPLYEVREHGLDRRPTADFAALAMYERADLQRLLREEISALGEDLLVIGAEITQLRGRCDRLFDELGGTDQGAWMPAIDVVPTTVWSCAWTCRVCVGGDVPGERGLQRHEPAP